MQELFRTAAADHGNMRGRERPYAANFLGLLFTYTQLVVDGEVDPTPELAYRLMHRFSHGIYS
jgi:TetR/AcrR family transcriptional regulator